MYVHQLKFVNCTWLYFLFLDSSLSGGIVEGVEVESLHTLQKQQTINKRKELYYTCGFVGVKDKYMPSHTMGSSGGGDSVELSGHVYLFRWNPLTLSTICWMTYLGCVYHSFNRKHKKNLPCLHLAPSVEKAFSQELQWWCMDPASGSPAFHPSLLSCEVHFQYCAANTEA